MQLCAKMTAELDSREFRLQLEIENTIGFRSEGKKRVRLVENTLRVRLDSPFFQNFQKSNLCGDNLALIGIVAFAPIFSLRACPNEAKGSPDFEEKIQRLTLQTNFEVSASLKQSLKNVWLLPNIEFECFRKDFSANAPLVNARQSLAWGGGLDSSAALCIFQGLVDPYILTAFGGLKGEGSPSIASQFKVSVIESNIKSLFDVSGFPMWLAPTIPALLRNDNVCVTGTILEAMFTQDGLSYRDNTKNKWATLFHKRGKFHPIYYQSEYLNAKILHEKGIFREVCGDFISVWGKSLKSLRKAIYAAALDPELGFKFLHEIEALGIAIRDISRFSEQSKLLNSVMEATRSIESCGNSISLNCLKQQESCFTGPWATKTYPLESAPLGLPEHFQSRLRTEWNHLSILEMSNEDLADLEKYSFRTTAISTRV